MPRRKLTVPARVAALRIKVPTLPRKKTAYPKVDMTWVVARLQERGVSQREVARQLGMDFASINRSITGARPLRPHELSALARLCNVTSDELLAHMGLPTGDTSTLRITHEITSTGEVIELPATEQREVQNLPGTPPGSVAAVFGSDTGPLSPFYGQVAIYPPLEDKVSPAVMDRLAVIRYGEAPSPILGTISRGSRWGRYKIKPFGSADVTETGKLVSASAVTGIRSI